MSVGTKFRNPMMVSEELSVAPDEESDEDPSVPKVIGESDGPQPLSDEELYDLGFAFEACDLDESGNIDYEELQAVLGVFGANITREKVEDLAKRAKSGAAADAAMTARFAKKKRKNKKGQDMNTAHPTDLNLSEFTYLMTSGIVDDFFPNGWAEGAYHMRLLKSVFQTADIDGDNELESSEFATAINSLHTGTLSETDKTLMWKVMNPEGKPHLTFAEFLPGMVAVQKHPVLQRKFHLFTPDTLMSLVLDTPVSRKEEAELLSGFTAMEKLGMTVLERQAKEMSSEEKRELLTKAQNKEIHVVTEEQRKGLLQLHHWNVWECFVAGLASAAVTAAIENVMTYRLSTNGVENPDRCNWKPDEYEDPITGDKGGCAEFPDSCDDNGVYTYFDDWKGETVELPEGKCERSPKELVITFWLVVGIVLGICCCFEIVAMYWYSIKNAVRVANVMDLRLKPLNRDRAFVGGSLVRAALELGNTQGVVFGTDPLREQSSKSAVIQALLALLYVAKIAMSGFLIKVLIKRLMTRGSAKFALPWAAVPATAIWNAFVGHIIMRQAKLRGVGVAMAIEIFSTIVDVIDHDHLDEISDLGKLQMCRAVACNIVKQRDMFPTKEILLKHAVANMGLIRNGLISADESGVVDDADMFVEKMGELDQHETDMVVQIAGLCTVLDGRVRKREMILLQDLIAASKFSDQYHVNPPLIKYVAQRTRNMFPLTLDVIIDMLKPDPELKLPAMFYVNECQATVTGCLAC